MEAGLEQFKQRAHATWAAGDFDNIATLIWPVGTRLVEDIGVEPGMRVVDLACGSGNAAIPAAAAGAKVTGLDITPELFDAGRRRAADAGVEVEWIEGDCEDLPFEDGSFDRVLSTFGIMFAPRHAVAAAEAARVCAPGGMIGFCNWSPTGLVGEMFALLGSRMPPPPPFAQPPPLWGTEAHVRELLEPHGIEVDVELKVLFQEEESVEAIVGRMENYFGPWIMAKQALGDGWPAVRADLLELYERWGRAGDNGKVGVDSEYLFVRGRKTG